MDEIARLVNFIRPDFSREIFAPFRLSAPFGTFEFHHSRFSNSVQHFACESRYNLVDSCLYNVQCGYACSTYQNYT